MTEYLVRIGGLQLHRRSARHRSPDQRFIGLADLDDGSAFVRARGDCLEFLPKGTSIYHEWRSSQPDSEVPVLRGRLAEILSAALDASGAGDPAEIGTLADAVRPRPIDSSDRSVVPFAGRKA